MAHYNNGSIDKDKNGYPIQFYLCFGNRQVVDLFVNILYNNGGIGINRRIRVGT